MIHFILGSTIGAEKWSCMAFCRDHSIRYYEGEGIKVKYVTIKSPYIHTRDLPGVAQAFFKHGDFSTQLQ